LVMVIDCTLMGASPPTDFADVNLAGLLARKCDGGGHGFSRAVV